MSRTKGLLALLLSVAISFSLVIPVAAEEDGMNGINPAIAVLEQTDSLSVEESTLTNSNVSPTQMMERNAFNIAASISNV